MKKRIIAFAILCLTSVSNQKIYAMDQGPMNDAWFYNDEHPFKKANDLHQEKKWKDAAAEYHRILQEGEGSEYDMNMARLNMAACLMAQRKPSTGWSAFDALVGIDPSKRLSDQSIADKDPRKTVLVKTNNVGIGDIFHFLTAAAKLKKETGCDITVAIRNFLKEILTPAAEGYGINLVSQDSLPETDYITHLISLLGYLKMGPDDINPDRVLFTAPERAMQAVSEKTTPLLAAGKNVAAVFLGENRQATLIGGKQLPQKAENHGRHLTSKPFVELLKKHPDLQLMDCGTEASRIVVEDDQETRCMTLPREIVPFDTIIALACIMNENKKIVCFGADQGPPNVFSRGLDKDAQDRMALIIPNPDEYDMRMEGDGESYRQMISNCRVYKCASPDNQTEVIELAYKEMTS